MQTPVTNNNPPWIDSYITRPTIAGAHFLEYVGAYFLQLLARRWIIHLQKDTALPGLRLTHLADDCPPEPTRRPLSRSLARTLDPGTRHGAQRVGTRARSTSTGPGSL